MDTEPNWEWYRSFVSVLETGSLSAAGRAMGLTQPTVGRHIDSLETALQLKLFTRSFDGFAPTDAALELKPCATALAATAASLRRLASGQGDGVRGTVRLTASEVIGVEVLPTILTALRRRHPELVIELVLSNKADDLLRREADIAVRMVRPVQQSLVARKLGEIEIVAAAHRSYLAKAPPLRVADDLARHRLIGYDRDDAIVRGAARLGLPLARSDFALRTDDQVVYGRLVAEGAGVGFVARYALRHWPGVVTVLPALVVAWLPCWLAVHREIRANPLVRTVYDFLAREIPAAIR
jgi:DNA-binding transcriptional LysR family regulator